MAFLLLLDAFCPKARAAFGVGYSDDLNIVHALAEDNGKRIPGENEALRSVKV